MIVEDEGLVALAIQKSLERLGYIVTGSVADGEDAFRVAAETAPDLILMDIRLQGDLDGIEVAERIMESQRIPVVYLTAHSDEKTLERAKLTEPFGYIVKPFDEQSLFSTVEIALYKAKLQTDLARTKEKLATILRSIREAVVVTDLKGTVEYLNSAAIDVFDIEESSAIGMNVLKLAAYVQSGTDESAMLPLSKIALDGETDIHLELEMVRSDATRTPVDVTLAGIRSTINIIEGLVVTLRIKS
jgi:PAS domain S-box-containing protein